MSNAPSYLIKRSYRHGKAKYRNFRRLFKAMIPSIAILGLGSVLIISSTPAVLGLISGRPFFATFQNYFMQVAPYAPAVLIPSYFSAVSEVNMQFCDIPELDHKAPSYDEFMVYAIPALAMLWASYRYPVLFVPCIWLFILLCDKKLENYADQQDLMEYVQAISLGFHYPVYAYSAFGTPINEQTANDVVAYLRSFEDTASATPVYLQDLPQSEQAAALAKLKEIYQ